MRDHHPARILAKEVKFAVDEPTIRAAEIRESAVAANVPDMCNGPLDERLHFFRRVCLRSSGEGEPGQDDRGRPMNAQVAARGGTCGFAKYPERVPGIAADRDAPIGGSNAGATGCSRSARIFMNV